MPWEKSFDEAAVVDGAMQVFWEKGYESTSMAELLAATGIKRGSLYNAFGGKHQLFLKALTKYDQENRRAVLAELEALDDPREAIEGLFGAIIEETLTDSKRKGCFLINTSLEISRHETDVAEMVRAGLRETEAFFRRCIEVGQARNEISKDIIPEASAKMLMATLVAIRVLGRGVFSVQELETVAAQAIQLLN